MIYIQDNIGRFVKREKNEMYTKMECTNQLTQSTFTINIPIKQPNGKFYQDIRVVVPNGSYDYSLYIGDKLAYTGIFTNIIEVEKKEVNNAYNVEYNTITYTPNQKPIEIPERVLEITENGEYDVTNFNKANVLVVEGTDCESIVKQLQEEITDLENDKADLEDAINTLENEVVNLEGEIADKEADIADLQDQINTIGKYTITSNGTYTPEAGILGWNEVVVNVPSNGTNCEDVITDLTNQINALEEEKQALLVQLDKALNNIEKLEAQIVELYTEIAQLNTEIEGLLLEKQQLENTVTDLQEKVNSVTSITINKEGTDVAPEGVLGYNEIIVDIQEPVEELPKYLWIKPLTGYITFSFITDGTLSPNFEYSYNTTNWKVWDYSALRIEENQKLYLRGVNNRQISNYQDNLHRNCFDAEGMGCDQVEIGGNLMALVDGEGTTKVIPADNMFNSLFRGFYSNLVYIPGSGGEYGVGESELYLGNLILPATTLTTGCYQSMFMNTRVLTYPKKLPATELKPYCYSQMFRTDDWLGVNVIRKLDAPTLFGKTLENQCCKEMFYCCNNIGSIICLAENPNSATYPFYMIFNDNGEGTKNVNFICNIALQNWNSSSLPTYKPYANYDPNVYMSYLPTNLLNSLVK